MGRVLVACEESQAVCKAFRELGHEAYSCDIQACSGGHPEWHIIHDAVEVAYNGAWDLIIAHPPCTCLTSAGQWFYNKYPLKKQEALDFFMKFIKAPCNRIAVENPRSGFINLNYRYPNQVIHPFYFDDGEHLKRTCLWLKNLPRLNGLKEVALKGRDYLPTPLHIQKNGKRRFQTDMASGGKARSKTFPGIARAMAEQWGRLI